MLTFRERAREREKEREGGGREGEKGFAFNLSPLLHTQKLTKRNILHKVLLPHYLIEVIYRDQPDRKPWNCWALDIWSASIELSLVVCIFFPI